MLLLTNPNDPLGVIYKPNVVLNAIEWARSNSIHTVVDEIFALTVHMVSLKIVYFDILLLNYNNFLIQYNRLQRL